MEYKANYKKAKQLIQVTSMSMTMLEADNNRVTFSNSVRSRTNIPTGTESSPDLGDHIEEKGTNK